MARKAILSTAISSYLQLGTIVVTSLVSFPLALRYLTTEQVGLWSFTLQSLGYLLLLDFGVTSSAGRLLGDPIHTGDPRECSRWFSLFVVVLAAQGLLTLIPGLILIGPLLNWFSIPAHLQAEARTLWLVMLALNAIAFPLRISAGILFAQNRYYWSTLGSAAGLWLGLLAFFLFLRSGAATLAYAYSAVIATAASSVFPWIMVQGGAHRFRFHWGAIQWRDAKELFNYSSSVFIIGIAIQVVFLSQSLVITKLVGLSAVALFTASSKAGTLVMQLLWRTFDSLIPHWQQLYIAGDHARLAAGFQRYTKLVISAAILSATILIMFNRPFVSVWARPDLHAGALFDLLLGLYILQHTWNHCLGFGPVVAKDLRPLTGFAILEIVLNISLSVIFVRYCDMGVSGVLVGGILGTVVTTGYLTYRTPRYFFGTAGRFVSGSIVEWMSMLGFAAFCYLVSTRYTAPQNLWMPAVLSVSATIVFLFLHRDDFVQLVHRAKASSAQRGPTPEDMSDGPERPAAAPGSFPP